MEEPIVSFIIPAFNEENNIERTIEDVISGSRESKLLFEIIVVDNNSTDKTLEICRSYEKYVRVYPSVVGTIARIRNFGTGKSKGSVLVFIDSDISLHKSWFPFFKNKMDYVLKKRLITGSKCQPVNNTYLSRGWFALIQGDKSNYINSGHMIMSRTTFDLVGGFNESLVTSEDVDICQRAQSASVSVENDSSLVALHRGYPESAYQFILREAWHGIQDVNSLNAFFRSKTATLSILSSLLIVFVVFSIIFFNNLLLAAFGILLSVGLAILFHFSKTRKITKSLLYFPISYLYFWGRSYSFFLKLKNGRAVGNRSPRTF
ncbi:glycosyltransferase [Marinobacter sp. ELB17]|uniref:glycosyltransferase n=1 Tax=Marinobacter sp. ELB17 TaxID=270374 RepID=UPI0002D3763A|nr:glycosyltransferase [Marinobacter sp. ELB17]